MKRSRFLSICSVAFLIAASSLSHAAETKGGFFSPEVAANLTAEVLNLSKTPHGFVDFIAPALKEGETEGLRKIYSGANTYDVAIPKVKATGASVVDQNGKILATFMKNGTVTIAGQIMRKSNEPLDSVIRSYLAKSDHEKIGLLDFLFPSAWAETSAVNKILAGGIACVLFYPWYPAAAVAGNFYGEVKAANANNSVKCQDGKYLIATLVRNNIGQAGTEDHSISPETLAKEQGVDPAFVAHMFDDKNMAICTPKNALALQEGLKNARDMARLAGVARMHHQNAVNSEAGAVR